MGIGPLIIASHHGLWAWISRWPVNERELNRLVLFCMEHELESILGGVPMYHLKCVWQPAVRMSYMGLRTRGECYVNRAFHADEPLVMVQKGKCVQLSRLPIKQGEYKATLEFCLWAKAFSHSLRDGYRYYLQFPGRQPRPYDKEQLDRMFG